MNYTGRVRKPALSGCAAKNGQYIVAYNPDKILLVGACIV